MYLDLTFSEASDNILLLCKVFSTTSKIVLWLITQHLLIFVLENMVYGIGSVTSGTLSLKAS